MITDAHDELILDPEKAANSFKTSVSENYTDDSNDLVYTDEKLKAFVESKLSSDVTFDIKPVTLTYVQNQLSTLDTAKVTGLDDLSAKMLHPSSRYSSTLNTNFEFKYPNKNLSW